jgi:hypothetical protein
MALALSKPERLGAPLLRAFGFVHHDSIEGRALLREGAWNATLMRSSEAVRAITGGHSFSIHYKPLNELEPSARKAVEDLISAFKKWQKYQEDTPAQHRIEIHRCMAELCEYAMAMIEDRALRTDEANALVEKVAKQLIDVLQRVGDTRSSGSLRNFTLGLETLDRQLPAEANS